MTLRRVVTGAALACLALACASAPPRQPQKEEEFARLQASQEALERRLAALEERMLAPRDPTPVAVVAQPEAPPPKLEGPVQISEGHYRVPRAYFDEMVEDPDTAMREARVVPVRDGSRATGLRLFAIRPNTHLAALGFRNGDQLRSLNGVPLTSPDQALKAYAQSRNADSLRVVVLREGRTLELRFDLVE